MPKRVSSLAKFLILGVLLAYAYYPTLMWMVDRWNARDSYFGHGVIIPFVSLYWILKKRQVLKTLPTQTQAWGLAVVAAGFLLQFASRALRIYFLSAFSFVWILFGTTAFLFGKRVLREVWFPLAFLMLAIPLPLLAISEITLQLKFFVSEMVAHLLNSLGISATREGSYLVTPHSVLLVGDPCSGLRSLLAFLCLGLVFAYESKISFWKKAVLFASGLPLAILSNLARVFFLCLLGEIYGMQITTGIAHDASGILVFVMAFIVFLTIRRKLETAHAEVG